MCLATSDRCVLMLQRLIVLCLLVFTPVPITAGEPPTPADADRLRGDITRLVGELDSNRFEVRKRAAERLDEFVAKPELAQLLADEFQQSLVRPDVSYEVRWRLTRWAKRLPVPRSGPAIDASPEEIEQLVCRLDDDSYSVRLGAAQRIESLANNPKLVCPLMTCLKTRLAEAAPGSGARQQLDAAWQRVRGMWLLGDAACCDSTLPPIANEQIEEWLDALVRVAPSCQAVTAQAAARRELLDALARDEYVPQVTASLQARLKHNPESAAQLQELLDWTKPALVAEYWYEGHQMTEQHLLVDVPTLSQGAARPTHFDRIDDHTAHYVTGNSLIPNTDYPVDVAFAHPKQEKAFFRLVNLPTPRRRMAYPCRVQIEESKRLAVLSRHTFDRFLAEKHQLTAPEALMLGSLDRAEVSRFAGQYFLLVADQRLPGAGAHPVGGCPSCFGMICTQLATDGTKDAVPGLTDAIAKKVFLPPDSRAPYRLHWLAAFSIASRDPWPEVDAWLAGVFEADESVATEKLAEGGDGPAGLAMEVSDPADGKRASSVVRPQMEHGAEVGASAAALLLTRHGGVPTQFDLQPVADTLMSLLHVEAYRFGSDEARAKVRQWWEQEKAKPATP